MRRVSTAYNGTPSARAAIRRLAAAGKPGTAPSSISTMADRSVAGHALAERRPAIVVASVRAATQRLSPTPVDPIRLTSGTDVPFDDLVVRIADVGYRRTERVESGAVGVLIDLNALIDGHATAPDGTRRTAETHGGTPLPVETIRRMACEAGIIPIVLGGDSQPLDVGRERRLATRAQRMALNSPT